MNRIKQTAEKILGRPLEASEGVDIQSIEVAEKKLDVKFPQALKDFYLNVGKLALFTDAFEFFAKPKQIYIKSNKLVFLEENQAVLSWGIDLNDLGKEVVPVYHSPNIGDQESEVIWYTEALPLPDFLELIMFYQAASADADLQTRSKGGYPLSYVGYKSDLENAELWDKFQKDLSEKWEKVVDGNGLVIYWCKYGLLLYYSVQDLDTDVDDLIYLSTRKDFDLSDFKSKFGFQQLD